MEGHPKASPRDILGRHILEEALEDVISAGAAGEALRCDERHLQTLHQTAQVAAALQHLQLCDNSERQRSSSSGDRDDDSATAAAAARFAGAPSCRLGVLRADLLAEALPSEAARAEAFEAVAPALEAELQRRCRLLAAASGYGTDDFTGLPDHLHQLQATATASQAAQAEAWWAALERAWQAVGLLTQAAQLLADLLREHKLQGQKAADEAHAAWLHSECAWLREKLRLVELQLRDGTYSEAIVGVLRQVAEEVDATVGQAAARVKQASMKLQQYQDLGPQFLRLAREHGAVVQAVEEAEYELQEIEQFRQLAAVTG